MMRPIVDLLTKMVRSLRSCLGLGPKHASRISKHTTNSSSTGGPDTNISIEDVPITGSGIQNLSADIYNALCDNWEDKKFLPNDEMRHFASEDSIQSIFGAVKAFASMDDLVRFIQNEALRLFLILVLMERKSLERELKSFQDNGFDDHALPIRFNRDNTASAVQGPDQSKRHCVFHHWERGEKELFASYQYRFTAPVFGTTEFHQQVPVGQWLPFLEVAPQPASSGYFGEVTRTVIHAKHIDPSSKLSTFIWTSKEPDQDGKRLQMDAIVIAVKKAKEGDEDPNPSYSRAAFFDKEVENLDRLRKYNSPHLIKPISGYRHGNNRCLIFPWADGGNLGDYWKQFPSHAGNKSRVLWQIRQFVGICSALEALHNDNIRHGDLKPENILWFDRSNIDGGTLQIADLGLAAFHEKEQHTQLRKSGTKTPSGTSRYEPPEMDQQRRTRDPHDPQSPKYGTRSRQYDIWSLGCVVLELLIWLACGPRDVEVFRGDTLYFWQKASEREDGEYMVHEHVVAVMGALSRYFKPGSAYECILQLVETRLLVVKVSRNQEHVPEDCRGSATKVHDCFAEISQRCQTDETFLSPSPDKLRYFQPDPNATRRGSVQRSEFHEKNGKLAVPNQRLAAKPTLGPFQTIAESTTAEAAGSLEPELPDVFQLTVRKPTFRQSGDNLHSQVSQASNHQENFGDLAQSSSKINDDWTSFPDNDFAARYFDTIGWDKAVPIPNSVHDGRCKHCYSSDSMDLFDTACDLEVLQEKARACELCSMLQDALNTQHLRAPGVVNLRRDTAHVGIKDGPNLLSLYCEPDSKVPIPKGAQLGLAQLFDTDTAEFYALLKGWIQVCDKEHVQCRRTDETLTMPTRLIEVGRQLRLVETADIEPSRYAALSHCWGKLEPHQKFCTYKNNFTHRKEGIDFEALPRTFRDAITVTRRLCVEYIWIDSLCIVQDDKTDWESEASKMEQVFSAAFFTIGASSAESSLQGFLANRKPRTVLKVPSNTSGMMYACLDTDNFHNDVELSPLNSRGWVLQERALSRRTMFFTSKQVYWECGGGIHCETLTRLKNSRGALLGDANFPTTAVGHYKDGRQLLIQDLYERYSGLAFTEPADRSVAILGLQKRLSHAFNMKAAHGLFDAYFSRGLLWKRRNPQRMERIPQIPDRKVPSWSSLSKEGKIQYLDATHELKFKEVDWADDFKSPFVTLKDTPDENKIFKFSGLAREMNLSTKDMAIGIRFDDDVDFEAKGLRCVVIGRDRIGQGQVSPKNHVLVIHQSLNDKRDLIWERVGVASLDSSVIKDEGSWVDIH